MSNESIRINGLNMHAQPSQTKEVKQAKEKPSNIDFSSGKKEVKDGYGTMGLELSSAENKKTAKSIAPAKGADLSKDIAPLDEHFVNPHPELANAVVAKVEDNKTLSQYDENGYLKLTFAEPGVCVLQVFRDNDGNMTEFHENKFNENGNESQRIVRNPDGSVKEYYDYEYDKAGNQTRIVLHNADGNVKKYWEMEYDKNGNQINVVEHNPEKQY